MGGIQLPDTQRLAALVDYRVLDTAPEPAFDAITQLAAKIFNAPIALISLVAEQRQWFKSRVGLAVEETPREYAFCDHAIRGSATFVVPDATADARFADNPLVTGDPEIRFYCGVPLRTPEGHALGTLCILDRVPRTISGAERGLLESLARQVEAELELRRRLLLMGEALVDEQAQRQQKELMAAMVVHDLRNPLTSIRLLSSLVVPANAPSQHALRDLQLEITRASHMLTDVLDICLHGVGGLRLRRREIALDHLVGTIAARFAHRALARGQRLVVELPAPPLVADVDPELLERVIENLVGNAMIHGPAQRPIAIGLRRLETGAVRLEVRDQGAPLTPEIIDAIFYPFERRGPDSGVARLGGRGLGLAFARLAVEAHGGRIGVESDDGDGNCFYLELPGPG